MRYVVEVWDIESRWYMAKEPKIRHQWLINMNRCMIEEEVVLGVL